jgi:hypothetical protein
MMMIMMMMMIDDDGLTTSTGYIPPELFTGAKRLQDITLSANLLHGELPNVITVNDSMISLDVSENHFHGPIPSTLGLLTDRTVRVMNCTPIVFNAYWKCCLLLLSR